jgi:carboxypeptidase family protein
MPSVRRLACVVGAAAAIAACARTSAAQVIRGSVVERGSNTPVSGALISLLSIRGDVIAEALTNEIGTFEIRLPGAGRYAIDAKRIGVKRVKGTPFDIAEGETRREDIVVEPIPSVLQSVRVTGRSSCVRRPEENVRTAGLWEDARAALSATIVTRRDRMTMGYVVKYSRKINLFTGRVLSETRREVPVAMERPFRSLAADLLSRDGYVRVAPDSSIDYFAPDADVLLSAEFLDDHCFRIRQGTDDHLKEIGLAFEPVPGRKRPDVKGVLWLDAATAELRSVEFFYTWLPYDERPGDFGGTIYFFRLPSGAWIVRSWKIRYPEFGYERMFSDGSSARLPHTGAPRLVRISEDGGAVPIGALFEQTGAVSGTVALDSATNRALPGVTVSLAGTSASDVTNQVGAFDLVGVDPGSYTVLLKHPVLDSLGMELPAGTVEVAPHGTVELTIVFPTNAALAQRMCPAPIDLEHEAVVRFIVVDSAGVSVGRAPFLLAWQADSAARTPGEGDQEIRIDGLLDERGSHVACGLPVGAAVRFEAGAGAAAPWRGLFKVSAGTIGWTVVHATAAHRPPSDRPEDR